MDSSTTCVHVEELLRHEAWVRRLVRRLVDAHEVDDVVQQTWVAALEQSERPRSVPGFLTGVARRAVARLRRDAARRRRRERRMARPEALPCTSTMLERVEAEREVARLVTELEEPFRTVILLRYFEGLTPMAIAARLELPAATVRTRLHRGRERIRQRLGARRGPDWRAGVGAQFSLRPEAAPSAAAPALLLSGGMAMGGFYKVVGAAVAVCVLLAIGWLALPALGAPDPGGEPAPLAPERAGVRAPGAAVAASELKRVEIDNASAAGPGPQLRGRVVDSHGAPMSAVPIRLRAHGRAGLGVSLAGEARSDPLGGFVLPCPEQDCAPVAGAGFATLRSTSVAGGDRDVADLLVVAAPAVRLEGTVVDADGSGLAEVNVYVDTLFLDEFPLPLDRTFDPLVENASTGPGGCFVCEDLPIAEGVDLVISKAGYRTRRLPATDGARGWIQVTLERIDPDPDRLRGQVIDAAGRMVAGAEVRLGPRQHTRSSESGEFELEWPRRPTRLGAVKRGYQPAVRDGVGRGTVDEPVILQLGGPTLGIDGTVRCADGRPAVGMLINLVDPTPAGRGDVAELLSAPGDPGLEYHALARTDAAGRFSIGGLADRSYRLRAFDPATTLSVQSEPIAAGRRDVVLTIPADAVIDELHGIVVDRNGRFLPGVRVKVHFLASRVLGSHLGIPGTSTTTDSEGRFVLRQVPRRHVKIAASDAAIVEFYEPIEECTVGGELRIEVLRRCHVRIEGEPGTTVSFADAQGGEISVMSFSSNRTFSSTAWTLRQPRSPVLTLPESAVTMICRRGDEELVRKAIVLDPSEGAVTLLIAAR